MVSVLVVQVASTDTDNHQLPMISTTLSQKYFLGSVGLATLRGRFSMDFNSLRNINAKNMPLAVRY
jgi:hypothetical protein